MTSEAVGNPCHLLSSLLGKRILNKMNFLNFRFLVLLPILASLFLYLSSPSSNSALASDDGSLASPAVASRDSSTELNSSGSSTDPGVLLVKPVVEVDGAHDVMLNDLVEARGVSQAVIDAIKDVRLSDAPKRAESRYFTADDLSQTLKVSLRQVMQKNGELPRFRIPSRVVVTRKALKIKSEDVQKAVLEQFKTLCSDCEFEFTAFNMPILPRYISADHTWSVRARAELPKGSFTLPFELRSSLAEVAAKDAAAESADGKSSATESASTTNHVATNLATNLATTASTDPKLYWVSGQVVIRRKGAVASRSANIGERLHEEDFSIKLHDVTFSNDSPATAADISNSVLARAVSAGDMIWRSQLRREMAIKSGDPVKVVAGSGDWEVTIEGISQSSAYIGDMVRVKIPRTQKLVSGLLRDKGVVELQ